MLKVLLWFSALNMPFLAFLHSVYTVNHFWPSHLQRLKKPPPTTTKGQEKMILLRMTGNSESF